MTFRTVTLTAVAALSLGMAASAQEQRTITVPLNEPGTAAPALTGPGTVVTRSPEGRSSVETIGGVPAGQTGADTGSQAQVQPTETGTPVPGAIADPEESSADVLAAPTVTTTDADVSGETVSSEGPGNVAAGTSGTGDPADTRATGVPAEQPFSSMATGEMSGEVTEGGVPASTEQTPRPTAEGETPAPQASPAEAQTRAATGTAAPEGAPAEPVPTDSAGEPPAAPQEGLPDSAAIESVTAPVVVETDQPTSDQPAADEAPAEDVVIEDAPAEEAPAADAPVTETPAGEAVEEAPIEEAGVAAPEGTVETVTPSDAQQPATDPEGATAEASEEAPAAAHSQIIPDVAFSFEGPFGTYDQLQLQRGLQIYTEICSACHGLKQVALRTLSDPNGPGLPEDQVRAYAAQMSIIDAETGEERPRLPTDFFPEVTGELMGPDLSLMAKARAGFHGPYGTGISQLVNGMGGPEYIHALLTGYTEETSEQAGTFLYENHAFPGGWISMAPPLMDDMVTYEDGSPTDLDSLAMDLSAFLMWTAEPKLMDRKQVGLVSVLFLILLTVLLYLTNKRLWWPLKHGKDDLGDGR